MIRIQLNITLLRKSLYSGPILNISKTRNNWFIKFFLPDRDRMGLLATGL